MHAGFGDDVHVEAVAQVDGVDVVAFEVAVHDGEEDLEEEVHGVEEDGEEEEPVMRKPRLSALSFIGCDRSPAVVGC